MGDHFVLLVDRLITESTIEAAIQSRNQMMQESIPVESEECVIVDEKTLEKLCNGELTMVECRICHDEDLDSNMESPCSCIGSLKYAHRRCVQRWCNEKGDTTCEICHQKFRPDYTAPPPLLQLGHVPLHFRGNWGISRRDVMEHRFITVVPTNSTFLERGYDNDYSSSTTNFLCCRSLVLIFMALLILRHILPLLLVSSNLHIIPLFTFLFLRIIGVILPIYVVTKAVASCRRGFLPLGIEATTSESGDSSDEEIEHSDSESSQTERLPQTLSYIIGVR